MHPTFLQYSSHLELGVSQVQFAIVHHVLWYLSLLLADIISLQLYDRPTASSFGSWVREDQQRARGQAEIYMQTHVYHWE